MKFAKLFLGLLVIPFFAFTSIHKYYISVTQVDYVSSQQAVQIITRVFIDDFEALLRERYDGSITLMTDNEAQTTDPYIKQYLSEKLKIKINGKPAKFTFIGKDYDTDIMRCYLEIENVSKITSIEITNRILFDKFENQQNIIKTKINDKQKSFILMKQKDAALLNFN